MHLIMNVIPSLLIILAYWLSCICIADTPEFNAGNYDVSQFDFVHMGLNESRGVNQRNPFVDNFLSKKNIALPNNDYLLIAHQGLGGVSSCIIIDLDSRTVSRFSSVHQDSAYNIIELSKSEFDYLSELVSSEIIKKFPSRSGNIGRGGRSLVVYSRSGQSERFISHWQTEYIGLTIFKSIHDYFCNKLDS